MSKRTQDYQKMEAKQSLWDFDGLHVPKRYRNKGKGRGKERRLIRQELDETAENGDNGTKLDAEG